MPRFLKRVLLGACIIVPFASYTAKGQLPPPVVDVQQPYPATPYTAQPYSTWPLTIQDSSGVIQIFQPQPEKLEGDKLSARAAVSLTPPGATDPVFGAIWLTARLLTDRDSRTVTIVDLSIRRVRFPEATDDQQNQFAQVVQREVPRLNVTFSLDQLMTSLDVAAKEKSAVQEFQATPPKILYTPVPATLVVIDGQPQLQPSPTQPGLMRVVNTPFIILRDEFSRQYFLKAGDFWYTAPDAPGPWTNVGAIPKRVADEGAALTRPPTPSAEPIAPAPPVNPGQIIVSKEPAELIWTDGQPVYAPLVGGGLLYVSNSQSDLFWEMTTQQQYVLLSGRWFRGPSLQGPWTYVPSDQLPPSFAQIPPTSPKGNVLVAVAGTQQAREARMDAQVPQTAAVDRNAGQSLLVAYDGEPRFEAIPQTPISYAVNSPEAVLWVNSRYYCCHQAVWYESLASVGPWTVSVAVPDVIYTLPPSCPVYYVRYCYVYDSSPTTVYCGYLPGYTGCYVYGPTVVYGTGYYYHGWYGHEYYPRPYTWGFGVRYDEHVATWGAGANYRYNRGWFVNAGDHHGWWGPRGYIDYQGMAREREISDRRTTINNTTVIHNTTINRLNIYNRTDNVRRNVIVNRNTIVHNEVRSEPFHASPVREPAHVVAPAHIAAPVRPAPHVENDIYAGHDGQIYRRTADGWEQRSGKDWKKTDGPPEAPPRVERPVEHAPVNVEHHDLPSRGQAHEAHEPAPVEHHDAPARVQQHDVHEPVEHHDAPARVQEHETHQPVEHHETPDRSSRENEARGNGGLEADHAARQRGVERAKDNGAKENSGHQQPDPSHH